MADGRVEEGCAAHALSASSSSPTMATTRGPCSTISGTRTFSTRSDTPKWRPTGSRIFGANRRRQARDHFRFPFNHLSVEPRFPLRHQAFDGLQGALKLLVGHGFDAAGM